MTNQQAPQTSETVAVVWLKRDLRLRDHEPLVRAAASGYPVLLLYIIEPILLGDPHYSARHWQFIRQSIEDINTQLAPFETQVQVIFDEATKALQRLSQWLTIQAVYSHQEIGLANTYDRDRQIRQWCHNQHIAWHESATGAVIRGLTHRRQWSKHWERVYRHQCYDVELNTIKWAPALPHTDLSKLNAPDNPHIQPGGEKRGWYTLKHFFEGRGLHYHRQLSAPATARTACSRISPYLAFGNLSVRQIYQYCQFQVQQEPQWSKPVRALSARLAWHDHFVQKFESEPDMQFRPVNQGYSHFDYAHGPWSQYAYFRWYTGTTGLPLVDACMRALNKTGYLNFRMRAMVTSVACHWLNLDWRRPAEYLASVFVDFEPGIHYAQIQMQAGITGTNTVRLYNPVKQSRELDPQGEFIYQWMPELDRVPLEYLQAPWDIPPLTCQLEAIDLPNQYHQPLIDITTQGAALRDKLWSFRQRSDVQREAKRILATHSMPQRQP